MVRLLVSTLIAAAGIAAAVPEIQRMLDRADAERPVASAAVAEARPASGGSRLGDVVITADPQGHFRVDARVAGQRLALMADTGATAVALRLSDARRLGLHPAPSDFRQPVGTANGTVNAARVMLDEMAVGSIRVSSVEALVLPDEALGGNLLGMTFLSRLSRFEVAGGKLVMSR
jgi:aspartyl protease family protein